MDRTEKIVRAEALKELIIQKRQMIKRENQELQMLEEQYKKAEESELPILLFVIDETLPMPDDYTDWRYEYIYYCPDLDTVKCIIRHNRNQLLPNSIDLSQAFNNVGMPKRYHCIASNDRGCWAIIQNAASIVKSQIDELFATNDINSWDELGSLLKALPNYCDASRDDEPEEKGQPRVLKPKSPQKQQGFIEA